MSVVNRVWDILSPGLIRWRSKDPDSIGFFYPGPGTFGVDTSDFCVESVGNEQEVVRPVTPDLSVPAGMVQGLWLFDGNNNDESSNTITLSGTAPGYTKSLVGGQRALWTDGSDVLTSPTGAGSSPIRIGGAITVELMLRLRVRVANPQYIVLFASLTGGSSSDNTMWGILLQNTNELLWSAQSGVQVNEGVNTGFFVVENQWMHIAVTRSSGGLVRAYVNGTLVAREQRNVSTGGSDSYMWVGEHPSGGVDRRFFGDLDFLRVIDAALRPEEVMAKARKLLSPETRP